MRNILIINGFQPNDVSEGRLNASLVERAAQRLTDAGRSVETSAIATDWDTDVELEKHARADAVILQFPVHWMGAPWGLKRYMDVVYTAGMDGRLAHGDGRTRQDPRRQYGAGGTMAGKPYLLSTTFNAPGEAFDDRDQYLFWGKGLDDLLFPIHMVYRFFDMRPLPTFAALDVHKNPQVEADFARFDAHLDSAFGLTSVPA
ncbi:MAG: NAD(P)H-dependent oxidoreductase [Pseudomonadota bacterium]